MNRPTPDPSQEGNSASVPDIDSPPPEGLGVGSWPQLTSNFWRCSLSMNQPPHPVPLPLRGGEGARRAGEGDVHGSDERLENCGNFPLTWWGERTREP